MNLRMDFVSRGLVMCFLHVSSRLDEDCQFHSLDDAQFATISARIQRALGLTGLNETFPKWLFQIVNTDLKKGLIWPHDTPLRDDGPSLLEVFEHVPPPSQGCSAVRVVHDTWLKVGLCRSEVIRCGE